MCIIPESKYSFLSILLVYGIVSARHLHKIIIYIFICGRLNISCPMFKNSKAHVKQRYIKKSSPGKWMLYSSVHGITVTTFIGLKSLIFWARNNPRVWVTEKSGNIRTWLNLEILRSILCENSLTLVIENTSVACAYSALWFFMIIV